LLSSDGKDRWEYIWGTGYFSCSKAYKHLKGHGNSPCFQVAMEVSLSTETQNLLLAVDARQIEHKRSVKKKKYGPRRL